MMLRLKLLCASLVASCCLVQTVAAPRIAAPTGDQTITSVDQTISNLFSDFAATATFDGQGQLAAAEFFGKRAVITYLNGSIDRISVNGQSYRVHTVADQNGRKYQLIAFGDDGSVIMRESVTKVVAANAQKGEKVDAVPLDLTSDEALALRDRSVNRSTTEAPKYFELDAFCTMQCDFNFENDQWACDRTYDMIAAGCAELPTAAARIACAISNANLRQGCRMEASAKKLQCSIDCQRK